METVGVQSRGPLFYLPIMFTDALPWSLCLPALMVAWWRERGRADIHHRVRTLLLLWIAIIVIFFPFSKTKRPFYIFPISTPPAARGGDGVARMWCLGPAAPAHT